MKQSYDKRFEGLTVINRHHEQNNFLFVSSHTETKTRNEIQMIEEKKKKRDDTYYLADNPPAPIKNNSAVMIAKHKQTNNRVNNFKVQQGKMKGKNEKSN